MKKIVSLLFGLWACMLHAQQVTPQVVTTSGATMVSGNTKVAFTVGEITTQTIGNGQSNLGQGVINSASNRVVTPIIEPSTSISLKAYPNPVAELMYVDVNSNEFTMFTLKVTDLAGRVISADNYSASNNHIGLSTGLWQAGTYLLSVCSNQGGVLGQYKVVKQ